MKASGSQNPSAGALRKEPSLSPGVLDHLPDGIVICQQAEDDLTIDYANGPFGQLLSLRARARGFSERPAGDRLEAQSREILLAGLQTRQGISILLRGSAEQSNSRLRLALRPLEDGHGLDRFVGQRANDRPAGGRWPGTGGRALAAAYGGCQSGLRRYERHRRPLCPGQ